jgi:hypothetical protein
MRIRIRIPLSWRRHRRYSFVTDQMEPLRRFFFVNISPDTIRFCNGWGKAYTVRFGVGYA